MPRYLGLNYFKEASESYHKSISEYVFSEPWHLERENNAVYIHRLKTSKQLFAGLHPWRKVVPDGNFLAKEALHVDKIDELLGGFNPFQCQIYTRLSGIIPSSLEEENVDDSTNSQMNRTNLMRSHLINRSTEIQVHNLNQLKADLEKGHEKFLDEPILHDYLSELQCIEPRKEIKFEKIDVSSRISDKLPANDLFLFKTYFPEQLSKDESNCNEAIEEQKQNFRKQYQYQICSSTQLTGDKYDHVLQEMCNVHLENLQKIDAWEKQQYDNGNMSFKAESLKHERCNVPTEVNNNSNQVKTEYDNKLCIERSPPTAKIAKDLQDFHAGSGLGSQSKLDQEIQWSNIDEMNSYLQGVITEKNKQQKIVLQKIVRCETGGENRRVEHQQRPKCEAVLASETKVIEESSIRSQIQTNPKDQNESQLMTGSYDDGLQNLASTILTQSCLDRTASEDTPDSLKSVLQNLTYQASNNSTNCQASTIIDEEKALPYWTNETNSEQSFRNIDFGKNTVSGDTCLEKISCCHIDDNNQDPPAKKLRRSNRNVEVNNSATFNPLDSFLFLRTGLALAAKKEQKQETEDVQAMIKLQIALKNEIASNSDVKITSKTQSKKNHHFVHFNPNKLTPDKLWQFKQEEAPSSFLPISTICSRKFSEMTELIRILKIKYKVYFVERSYESIFDKSKDSTWPFFYSDLIVDEQTCISLCEMEELENSDIFTYFRRRIYHLLLKFNICWIIVLEQEKASLSFNATKWKYFTKLSVWASQLSNTQCDVQVKVLYNDNKCSTMAEVIRQICDHTIVNNRMWKENQWANRRWIIPQISAHEKFLLAFPCINSFNAQAMLGTLKLKHMMELPLQDLVRDLPCIPPKFLKMFHMIIHWKSPVYEHLSKPDTCFLENANYAKTTQGDIFESKFWRPESSYLASETTNFAFDPETQAAFTLNIHPCRSELENLFTCGSQQRQISSIPMVPAWLQDHEQMPMSSDLAYPKTMEETAPSQPYLPVVTDDLAEQLKPEIISVLSSHISEPDYREYGTKKLKAINTPYTTKVLGNANTSIEWATRSVPTSTGCRLVTRSNFQTAKCIKQCPGKLRYQKVAGNKGQTRLTFN